MTHAPANSFPVFGGPEATNCNIVLICCQISFLLGQEKLWTNSIVILPKNAHLPLRDINKQHTCLYRSASVCMSVCHDNLSHQSQDEADNTRKLISGIWKTGRSIGQLRGFKGLLSQQEVGVTGMMVLSALQNGSSSSDCPVSFRAMTIPITVRDLKQSLDKQLFKSRYWYNC